MLQNVHSLRLSLKELVLPHHDNGSANMFISKTGGKKSNARMTFLCDEWNMKATQPKRIHF